MPKSKSRKKQAVRQIPRTKEIEVESPKWYVYLMVALMSLGVVSVLAYYIFELGRGFLVAGLIGIAAGFLMTTNWH